MSAVDDPALTVEEAAPLLKTTPIGVRRRCASGRLAAKKDGTRWLIRRSAIDAYLTPDNTPKNSTADEPERFETAAERRRSQRLAS